MIKLSVSKKELCLLITSCDSMCEELLCEEECEKCEIKKLRNKLSKMLKIQEELESK
jgi:hypothetical protein